MDQRRKRILLYVLGTLLIGFILLTLIVLQFPFSIIDREFSEEIQEHQFPILDFTMKLISWFGNLTFAIIMVTSTSLIFFVMKYNREAYFICLTLLSGVITAVLKIWFNRPRPTADMVRVIEEVKRQSFPSGHVFFYVVFFGFLTLLMYHLKSLHRIFRLVATCTSFFLIFTIPISRVYLGAHWFTDVLGGFLLGMIFLLVLGYFYLENSTNRKHH